MTGDAKTNLTVTELDIGDDELLMVFFHKSALCWWATVSPQDSDDCRAFGEGDTPLAALGALLLDLTGQEQVPN